MKEIKCPECELTGSVYKSILLEDSFYCVYCQNSFKENNENKFDYQKDVEKLWNELQDKMEFGLKKYGSISFQSSKENLDKCDLFKHIEEELIDNINYSLALIIKNRELKKKLEEVENGK